MTLQQCEDLPSEDLEFALDWLKTSHHFFEEWELNHLFPILKKRGCALDDLKPLIRRLIVGINENRTRLSELTRALDARRITAQSRLSKMQISPVIDAWVDAELEHVRVLSRIILPIAATVLSAEDIVEVEHYLPDQLPPPLH